AAEPVDAEADVEDEETTILMFTSGTTSLPKGVLLTYGDFSAYVTANVELADGTPRGAALLCAPLYHIAGATNMMTTLWTGRRLARSRRARAHHARLRRADHDEAPARPTRPRAA